MAITLNKEKDPAFYRMFGVNHDHARVLINERVTFENALRIRDAFEEPREFETIVLESLPARPAHVFDRN